MSQPSPIDDMIERVRRSFCSVDVLVNNAGIRHVATVADFPPNRWDAILSTNLSAAFHTTCSLLREMRQRGFVRIVGIASVHGLIASPFRSAYVLAKARRRRLAQGGSTRNGGVRRELQRRLSRICAEPAGGEAGRGAGEGARYQPRRRDLRRLPRRPADAAVCDGGTSCRRGRVPVLCGRCLHHRRRPPGRWRLDGALRWARDNGNGRVKTTKRPRAAQGRDATAPKPISLALQGGGAHGAVARGVLDRLLEDSRLEISETRARLKWTPAASGRGTAFIQTRRESWPASLTAGILRSLWI